MDGLRSLPDNCVQCTVTSPPYFALRDYGVEGQIGLEETPEEFIREDGCGYSGRSGASPAMMVSYGSISEIRIAEVGKAHRRERHPNAEQRMGLMNRIVTAAAENQFARSIPAV